MATVRDDTTTTGTATQQGDSDPEGATDASEVSLPRRQPVPVARVRVNERLTRLLETTTRPDGQLWTITGLTEELNARGHEVSRQYVGHLVTGARDNPPLRLLEVLADVFGVPVAYFSDDYLGRVTNDLLPLLAAGQDPDVRALLHRTDLPAIAAILAATGHVDATPELAALMARSDLPQIAAGLTDPDLIAWLGTRPLTDMLATLRAPVVRSAVEDTLAGWLKYGTAPGT